MDGDIILVSPRSNQCKHGNCLQKCLGVIDFDEWFELYQYSTNTEITVEIYYDCKCNLVINLSEIATKCTFVSTNSKKYNSSCVALDKTFIDLIRYQVNEHKRLNNRRTQSFSLSGSYLARGSSIVRRLRNKFSL
ncbi:hypothetical protein PV-S19_0215 [Pacmanvirus S19]|nr:hypothetical protein PV-S19_0215 [Pacmanvirus S19]